MLFADYRNIRQMLVGAVERFPDAPAYQWFTGRSHAGARERSSKDGKQESISWTEFYHQTKLASKSLMSLGVEKMDKIAIVSNTCYPWVLTDFSATAIGACTVGVYQSTLAKDCQHIIDHSDSVLVFVEDAAQYEKIKTIKSDISRVRKVIFFKGIPPEDGWALAWEDFLQLGMNAPDADLEARAESIGLDDPAGIIYTSGTTGRPKGVVLTHNNIIFTAQSCQGCGGFRPGDSTLLFLPLAHVFARTAVYTAVLVGNTTVFSRGLDALAEDFKTVRPHWFVSAPRIFEKIYARVQTQAEAKGGPVLAIFRWASEVGRRISDLTLAGQQVPALLGVQHALADRLVFRKIRAALGGRIRWCVSGAAPLDPDIARFFHSAGILILEGLGMTENTSFSNLNRIDNYRFGWVGPPGPGIEQRISEDGEIQFKGRNVMAGYYKMPEETAKTFTQDGWLKTGDLGEIDEENFLRITGRKKELIITAGGKNIAPAPIEQALTASRYIHQACVVGDGRKCLSAVVSLDSDATAVWAQSQGIAFDTIDDLIGNEKIQALIKAEVAAANQGFASFETVKKVVAVPEFTIENRMMTPTMKLKKSVIIEHYKAQIDALYQ